MTNYIELIKTGKILPPQYLDGNSPSKEEWLEEIKQQEDSRTKFYGEIEIPGSREKLRNLYTSEEPEDIYYDEWLVFNDLGVEKLIPKKPIISNAEYRKLYEKGLIDRTNVTLQANGKKYQLRLIEGYMEDITNFWNETNGNWYSEWNRLIIKITEEPYCPSDFDVSRCPNIKEVNNQYARYNWFNDLYGSYVYTGITYGTNSKKVETLDNFVIRGNNDEYPAVAGSDYEGSYNWEIAWVPLLEEIKEEKNETVEVDYNSNCFDEGTVTITNTKKERKQFMERNFPHILKDGWKHPDKYFDIQNFINGNSKGFFYDLSNYATIKES